MDDIGNKTYEVLEGFDQSFCQSEVFYSIKSDQLMWGNIIKRATDPELPFYTEGGSFYMNDNTRFPETVSEGEKGQIPNILNNFSWESVATIPIVSGNCVFGLILIADTRKNWVPLDMVELLENIAIQVCAAVRRIMSEEAFRKSDSRYKEFVEKSPDIVYTYSSKRGALFWSPQVKDILGFDPEHLQKQPFFWHDLIHPDDLGVVDQVINEINTKSGFDIEYRIKDLHGNFHWLRDRMINRERVGDEIIIEGIASDITLTKHAEERIKASLREKDVLLREVHHRVKNNLQIVSSLLSMMSLRTKNKEAVSLFKEAGNKIYTMALIHNQLYQKDSFDRVHMGDFIRDLLSYQSSVYSIGKTVITSILGFDDILLSIDQAIPCAIVLNEFISNAYKHAFRKKKGGSLEISIIKAKGDIAHIRLKDDGIGISEDFDIKKLSSLGLKLARDLLENQLKGTMQLKRNGGTEVNFEFKMSRKDP